jgi:chromosome segregation ATPase
MSDTELSVAVRNLGGIDESTVRLRTGVNVLSGRNATNRTSFLRALMGALGSDNVSLKADAQLGEVTLQTASGTYSRRLERQNGSVVDSGSPYLDDPTLADLFAFLLESNEARLAVSRTENLRELLLRPVDVEAIQAEIDETVEEKRRLDSRIDELSNLDTERLDLKTQKATLEDEIEQTRAEFTAKQRDLEAMDSTVESSRTEKQEFEATLDELQSIQSELEETRFRRETERESIEMLRAERAEIEAELDDLPETAVDEREEIESRLNRLRDRQSELDTTTSQLQSVIQFNEEMLEGTNTAIVDALRGGRRDSESSTDGLTGQLLAESESVVCWTCGSEVDTEDIESTIDRLKTVRQETLTKRSELRTEIETLTDRQRSLKATETKRTELTQRRDRTQSELDSRTDRIDSLTEEIDELREQATELEAEIDAGESLANSAVLEQQTAINQLEFDLDRQKIERQQLADRLETVESELDERDELKTKRDELRQRLTELRTQVDRVEAQATAQFNEHMDAVLASLGYDNLERIWIERTTEMVSKGRRTVEQSVFELHIVRNTEDNRSYEDTIDNLSESEREVTGLVFALAGYLVHEVHEVVPFMILDSLEAIDSDRIAALVDYFTDYVETIVVALLPEDAKALDHRYHRVTEI